MEKTVIYKENESNEELLNKWFEDTRIEGYSNEELAKIAAKEFKFALIEDRKNYYRQGKLICLAEEGYYFITSSLCRKSENYFFNLSDSDLEKRKAYFHYVRAIETLGRSIEDIFEFEPEQIHEISKLEQPEKYEEVEKFVREHKVGNKYLKRIIQIIREDESVSLESAFEQAKNEAKAKREDIKSGSALERRYKLLKIRYKLCEECNDKAWAAHRESEKLRRKFQKRSEKWSKLNTELNERLKALIKALRKKTPDINELKSIVGLDNKNQLEGSLNDSSEAEVLITSEQKAGNSCPFT